MKIKQNVKNEMVQNNVHVFVMDNFGYRRVSIHDVIYLEASRNFEHVSRYIGNFVRMIDDREITIGRDYQETIRKSFILIGSRKRVIEKRKQRYGG